jgi:hypothetical protein
LRELPLELELEPEPYPVAVQFDRAGLRDAVTLAQSRMAEARNPSDAVVAGWLAFEDAAADLGWVREPHETATEFTTRLLATSQAPPQPIATLRSLYLQVRFGSHIPTDDDVALARNSLSEIAEFLGELPKPNKNNIGQSQTLNLAKIPPAPAGMKRNKWGED